MAWIAHLDLDCFYVSVERINDPSLIGKPVVVGGSPKGRGVVASASYEARAFGVRSAMPTAQALRLCPSLIVVRGHHEQYGDISHRLYERMLQLAPVVERASIDEMYLDFTGTERLYDNDLPGFMKKLKQIVREEFSLPCTVALSANKLVSKIATGVVKPDGVVTIPHGEEAPFLAPLPTNVIPGVGSKTEEFLTRHGFRTVADIQKRTQDEFMSLLGKHGLWIYAAAHGRGSEHLTTDSTRKSISREETFGHDIQDPAELEKILFELTEDVCATLRKKGWKTRTISIKFRYTDFTTFTRDHTVEPTDHDAVIYATAVGLLRDNFDRRRKLRLIGVRLSNFAEETQLELDLDSAAGKNENVLKAMDQIRKKFGHEVMHLGTGQDAPPLPSTDHGRRPPPKR
ncbi:MAG: DNA polymerase IV [Bacteroidetes bacterium]|jgi:DNA polymerase-4|nr:DNA polymerase IV [Bacteroidota bacterium]